MGGDVDQRKKGEKLLVRLEQAFVVVGGWRGGKKGRGEGKERAAAREGGERESRLGMAIKKRGPHKQERKRKERRRTFITVGVSHTDELP